MQPDQNQETRRAALYARASGQDEEAIQTQLDAMQPHVEENGLEVVREYVDQQGSRAQFEEMLAEAAGENPPFRQVLVYDLRPTLALTDGIPGVPGKAGRERRNPDLHHIAR